MGSQATKHPAQWVLQGANAASMVPGSVPYGLIEGAAIAIDGDSIVWTGSADNLPDDYHAWHRETLPGGLLTPTLIDCHTHIVYGGNRAHEWEMRLNGASYEEISRAGGGIRSTVAATRAASEDDLITSAQTRLDDLIAEGLGAIEIKSGYGLDIENECKMLRVARDICQQNGIVGKTSFLGAHAIPAEFAGQADRYVSHIIEDMLPAVVEQNLADFCDGFCENIAFSKEQIRKIFEKAKSLGLGLRLHAEQLSNSHGAQMAAELGALSCDHLEYIDQAGIRAMAKAGCKAVLLPGAYYFLGESKKPPIIQLREYGVEMALATDCNPGSSPLTSLLLVMNMGCTLFALTPEEALAGITRVAAGALGLSDSHGTLEVGKIASMVYWNVDQPVQLAYPMGGNRLQGQVRNGQWVAK